MNLVFKDIITINNDYLNYLRSADKRVMVNHNTGHERPNVSVLVDDNGQLWAIPMSHKEFIANAGKKEGDSFFNIYFDSGKIHCGGHLKFNNMIPVIEGTFVSVFEKYSKDNSKDNSYVKLLNKQKEVIKNSLNSKIKPIFYKALALGKEALAFDYNDDKAPMGYKKYLQTFLNFELLIKKAKEWSIVHEAYDKLNHYIELPSPNIENYEAFNHDFKLIYGNYEDVFKYSNSLQGANKKLDNYLKYVLFIDKEIEMQKVKKIDPPVIKSFGEFENIALKKNKPKGLKL